MSRKSSRQRGVSLIEALVALAVMAFGMLGVAGMQSSLRLNSDVARQRSEALRIAQEAIETARSFTAVQAIAGKSVYDAIVDSPEVVYAGFSSNTTFRLTQTVSGNATQNHKTLIADVRWTDRSDTVQNVRLTTTLHRLAPELAAALAVPGSGTLTQLRGGRHASIPPAALDQGDGTSRFDPPGAGTVSWVFNNTTGYITSICVAALCSTVDARLLSGFVAFATGATQPTPAIAESPTSVVMPVQVELVQTFPTASTVSCFEGIGLTTVSYYCAVTVDVLAGSQWSGHSQLQLANLASTLADNSSTNYKVCRYTPYRDNRAVGTGSPAMTDDDHPYDYVNVKTALANQNFLVMRAGDGTTAFACPDDNPSPPSTLPASVNTNTWHHQPSS